MTMAAGYRKVSLLRLATEVNLLAGKYGRAGELLDHIRENFKFTPADELNEGALKVMQGRHNEAVGIFRKIVSLQYTHFLALNNLGYSLIALDRPQEALPYVNKGLAVSPKFAHLYTTRGWAMMKLGEWETGLADVQRSLELDKEHAEGHRLLGLYAMEKGRVEEARTHLLRARELDPHLLYVDELLIQAENRLFPI